VNALDFTFDFDTWNLDIGNFLSAHSYLFFPRKPLRGAVNGMTWPPCSIGSGSQICPVIKSIHILRGGVRSRTTLASFPCSFSLIWHVMPCAPQSPVRL
jgi:hypothetical protein